VLGPKSNSTAYPAKVPSVAGSTGHGMATAALEAAWSAAFASEDPKKGGCPAV